MKANRLCVLLGALVRGAARRPILRDRSGAVWVYVAVTGAVMLGMVGLTLDFGRFETLNTQAQDAADAAALAAASQLNGQAGAITRATNAATTTLLVQNQQAISSTGGTVTMLNPPTFYSALNSATAGPTATDGSIGTVTTDDTKARFVQVTTQPLPHDNWFIPAIGASASATTAATAVAGNEKVVCKIPPLFICNPQETATNTNFDIGPLRGTQVLAKLQTGSISSWAPGNFSLLQIPVTSSSTLPDCIKGGNAASTPKCIEEELAAINPGTGCVSATVNVTTGQKIDKLYAAINTRFDMWQDANVLPMSTANYAPAQDVVKGLVPTDSTCSSFTAPAGPAMALPPDTNISTSNRFGNGQWDCFDYWRINHPNGPTAPAGCGIAPNSANGNTGLSRWAVYQYEISNNIIPNNTSTGTKLGGEDGQVPGNPQCASTADTADGANRRAIYVAVVNCLQNASQLQGNSGGQVPVEAFVRLFITQPAPTPPSSDFYFEFVDVAKPGDGVLHDIVQLFR